MTGVDERRERVGDAAPELAPAPAAGRAGFVGALLRRVWFWAPIAPLVALDLWSKAYVFAWLERNDPHLFPQQIRVDFDFLPEPFGFSLVRWENTGTVWGLFQDFTGALMVLRAVALVVLIYIARRTARSCRLQLLTLGLIFAGAVGNLYDNLFMPGRAVRDFLLFYRVRADGSEAVFPAFNVADSCITVGAIALLVLLWREPAGKRDA
ncbi:MAG: signal peptidase II [Planctomycetes bacterium]|nr:signal peptidase II [Planctomycetota bacterium]